MNVTFADGRELMSAEFLMSEAYAISHTHRLSNRRVPKWCVEDPNDVGATQAGVFNILSRTFEHNGIKVRLGYRMGHAQLTVAEYDVFLTGQLL